MMKILIMIMIYKCKNYIFELKSNNNKFITQKI